MEEKGKPIKKEVILERVFRSGNAEEKHGKGKIFKNSENKNVFEDEKIKLEFYESEYESAIGLVKVYNKSNSTMRIFCDRSAMTRMGESRNLFFNYAWQRWQRGRWEWEWAPLSVINIIGNTNVSLWLEPVGSIGRRECYYFTLGTPPSITLSGSISQKMVGSNRKLYPEERAEIEGAFQCDGAIKFNPESHFVRFFDYSRGSWRGESEKGISILLALNVENVDSEYLFEFRLKDFPEEGK